MIHWERRNGERKCNPCPPSWQGRSRSRGIPSRCFHATRLVDRIKTKKSKVFPQPHWLVVALATGPLSSSVNPAQILGEADNGHGFPSIDVPKKIPRRRIHLAAVWAEPALDCIKLASANFHVAELGPEVPRRWLISTQGERRESASRKNVRLAAPTPAVSHLNNAPDIQCLHGECYWCCRQRTEIRSDPTPPIIAGDGVDRNWITIESRSLLLFLPAVLKRLRATWTRSRSDSVPFQFHGQVKTNRQKKTMTPHWIILFVWPRNSRQVDAIQIAPKKTWFFLVYSVFKLASLFKNLSLSTLTNWLNLICFCIFTTPSILACNDRFCFLWLHTVFNVDVDYLNFVIFRIFFFGSFPGHTAEDWNWAPTKMTWMFLLSRQRQGHQFRSMKKKPSDIHHKIFKRIEKFTGIWERHWTRCGFHGSGNIRRRETSETVLLIDCWSRSHTPRFIKMATSFSSIAVSIAQHGAYFRYPPRKSRHVRSFSNSCSSPSITLSSSARVRCNLGGRSEPAYASPSRALAENLSICSETSSEN